MSARRRQAARAERGFGRQISSETPWPLPTSGLNSKAEFGRVRGQLAQVLNNGVSDGISIKMRDGYSKRADTTPMQRIPFEFGDDDTYIEIRPTEATDGTAVYVRDFPGDVMATEISANVLMADGAGEIVAYDGTAFSDAGFTTTDGKDPAEFDGVFSHQDRPYLWDSSTLDFYYGDVGAVTGLLTKFPLSRLGNITGKIMILDSMTVNAAHGMNDVLVIVTTTGWIILYEGLNPGDATDWRLLGRVRVAAPVSKFAVESFGSDLWFLTTRGLVSVQESLAKGVMALVSEVAKPTSDLIVADIKAHRALPGWQIVTREDGEQVMLNVPTDTGFKQYVFRVDAPAWQTTDFPARWWHNLSGFTEFTGSDGRLYRPESDIGDDGADITMTWHSAWVRIPGRRELAYLVPTIIANGPLEVKVAVLTNNNETAGDIAQAEQIITLEPENPGTSVTLNEVIGINASGRSFKVRWEITGSQVEFVDLTAGLG